MNEEVPLFEQNEEGFFTFEFNKLVAYTNHEFASLLQEKLTTKYIRSVIAELNIDHYYHFYVMIDEVGFIHNYSFVTDIEEKENRTPDIYVNKISSYALDRLGYKKAYKFL